MLELLRLAELCAGYGGLGMALRQAGWPVELCWYAENDAAAASVMAAHHPDVPNVGDLTTAQFTACEPVDVLAAGYPCQPFSAAGLRRGVDDERWIWPDIARAVRLLRPRWVLLENVPGHLVRGASEVVADLAGIGYVGSWTCVRASDVGAPHKRERLFILAWPVDSDPTEIGRRTAGRHDGVRTPGLVAKPGAATGRAELSLLPTPKARDHKGRDPNPRGHDLNQAISLLPTPRVTDGTKGGPNQRGSSGDLMLPSAVMLLPTPVAGDANGSRTATANRSAPLHTTATTGWTLADVAHADRWGAYGPAIACWEAVLGWPAPDPTEPGSRGQARLAPLFVEWLMGLPAGHVTDHVGRNAALRILGNGVVPQQGDRAVHQLTAALRGVPTDA